MAARAEAIALFYLPSYAPDFNPDGYLNGEPKLSVARRAPTVGSGIVSFRAVSCDLRSLRDMYEPVPRAAR